MPEDRVITPPEEDVVENLETQEIPQLEEDERKKRIEARKKKIAEWIQKITARSQNIKDWSEYGARTRNTNDLEPNIDDADDFLEKTAEIKKSLYEKSDEIEGLASEILNKLENAENLKAEDIDNLIAEAEAMYLKMEGYYQEKSQFEANLEYAKEQAEVKIQESLDRVSEILRANSKQILKGTNQEWRLNYPEENLSLEDYDLPELESIIQQFNFGSTLRMRVKKFFPKNKEAYRQLAEAIKAYKVSERRKTEIELEINASPSLWFNNPAQVVNRRLVTTIRKEIYSWSNEDAGTTKILESLNSISKDFQYSSRDLSDRYRDGEKERTAQELSKIIDGEPTDELVDTFKGLDNISEGSREYPTRDRIYLLLKQKMIDKWIRENGGIYQEYKQLASQLDNRFSRDEIGYQIDALFEQDKEKESALERHKMYDKRISSRYISFFRNEYPNLANIIQDELDEQIKLQHARVMGQISTPVRHDLPGGSGFIINEPIDFTQADSWKIGEPLEEIIRNPDYSYYPILFNGLRQLHMRSVVTTGVANRMFMAAAACRAERADETITEAYPEVWHQFISLLRRPEEFNFLLSGLGSYSNKYKQATEERVRFFNAMLDGEGKTVSSLNLLMAEGSHESRWRQYETLVQNIEVDTLVLENLLRHEISFENASWGNMLFLLDRMVRNRGNQSISTKAVVPPPQISDLFDNLGASNEEEIALVNRFSANHLNSGFLVESSLFKKLIQREDLSYVTEVVGEYLQVLDQVENPNKDQVIHTVDKFLSLVDAENILDAIKDLTEHLSSGHIGRWMLETQRKYGIESNEVFIPGLKSELKNFNDSLESDEIQVDEESQKEHQDENEPKENPEIKPYVLDESNWKNIMYIYIQSEADMGYMAKPTDGVLARVKETFKNDNAKEFCLNQIQSQWLDYLESGENGNFPYELSEIAEVVDHHMGAGPLKFITSLSRYVRAVRESNISKHTSEITSESIFNKIVQLEQRLNNEKWSQLEKTKFYDISVDIIENAPSLYDEFMNLMIELDKRELQTFNRDTFPLFQARMAIVNVGGEVDQDKQEKAGKKKSEIRYQPPRDFVQIRRELRQASRNIEEGSRSTEQIMDELKAESLNDVRRRFQEAFGITKIPETFTAEIVRSIQNNSRYLANFKDRDQVAESKLSLFLALKINDKWDNFRQMDDIGLSELFDQQVDGYKTLEQYMEARAKMSQLLVEVAGIEPENVGEFWQLLNKETNQLALMNIQSVDQKLEIVLRNLEELRDPDVFENDIEKELVGVYGEYGVATVNRILAQSFQQMKGRNINLSEADQEIQGAIKEKMANAGLDWTPDSISAVQKQVKTLSSIQKTLDYVAEQDVAGEIEELREVLIPSPEVVSLFQKLGEDFSTESGAVAVTQDLDFLQNMIVKNRSNLSDFEVATLEEYITNVRVHISNLDEKYDLIKQRFTQFSKSTHDPSERLQNRLDEIQKIINQEADEKEYLSVATNDIDLVIENIRACLGCLQKEINNDTNLTFGDPNKFFVMTRNSNFEGSVSDQIVLTAPLTSGEEQSLSLVFDRMYGVQSADIFMNHVSVIWQKYLSVKARFPGAKVSVFVTDSALSSAGVSKEIFEQKVAKTIGEEAVVSRLDGATVDVPESAGEDHYIEFGGGARTSGERQVSGFILSL